MKKTVSINIGGIIFHIEEDGYEKLKNYLDSVNKYFSTFEDSQEIISDIESRIAEIFLMKLSDGRQIVTIEDVGDLMATMGTTRDFEATIETEPEEKTQQERAHTGEKKTGGSPGGTPSGTPGGTSGEGTRRLYRDVKRKVLGGVAAGIAHYFGIDPLWIRLLFIALFINFFMEGVSGATLLAYIILWIVMPPSEKLEEDTRVKKLFRNPDDRVLGGVSGGIASYFGIDPVVVRLLFVLSIFLGGAGILIYIILWIITPEAKTITEKMQMQGEPVTLSNIEVNIKKSFSVKEGEESPWVKILLFPFRFIAILLNGLGRILGPPMEFLAEAVRVIFGALIVLVGLLMMIGFVAAFLTLLGVDSWMHYGAMSDLPLELLRDSLNSATLLSVFGVVFIPALALALLGIVIITKRRVANAYVGWSLFSLWILSLVIAAFSVPRFVGEFRAENRIRRDQSFAVTASTPTLKLNDAGMDFDDVDLRLRGHEDSLYQLILEIESRGATRNDAEENAKRVVYNAVQEGNDFIFDSGITYPDGVGYRFQEVQATFYIPYGKVFRMDRDLEEILVNTLHLDGYHASQMEGNDWVFERDGIRCLTCSHHFREDNGYRDEAEMTYPFDDFDELKVAFSFDVEITRGDEYKVTLLGDERDLQDVYLNQVGDVLEVKFKNGKNWQWWRDRHDRKIALRVTMPELELLDISGNCEGEVSGFNTGNMNINLTGASELFLDSSPENIDVQLTGASELTLRGRAKQMDAELIGASELRALDFECERVFIDAIGASTAYVHAEDELEVNASGASTVKYRGAKNVSIDEDGLSTVRRY